MQTGLYLFECGTPNSIIENKLTHNLFPNPTKAQFIIKNSNAKIFTLYNSLGIKVLEQEIHKNQNTIYREGLSNGLYFYTLNTEGKVVESGKVIFE
jgi:hypothetical protein